MADEHCCCVVFRYWSLWPIKRTPREGQSNEEAHDGADLEAAVAAVADDTHFSIPGPAS